MIKKLSGGLELVSGYLYSAIECGIRYENRTDFCLIASEKDCNASAVFTTNKVCAAPVTLSRERKDGIIRGILINSTNANACTGDEGYAAALKLVTKTEEAINAPKASILNCSTGIIGRQLPVDKMLSRIGDLAGSLSRANGEMIPKAIMTTDNVPKSCCYEFATSGGNFKIAVTAKGAGMIAPNMATLLCFAVTDAPIDKKSLDAVFSSVVENTLNAITIDGDMSTNDTAIILSPKSGEYLEKNDVAEFEKALFAAMEDIARQLVKDGEGATKCVDVIVKNAASIADAKKCAKSVAQSLLVKTAFFGNDPNWGRVACAAGYSEAEFDAAKLDISFDSMMIFKDGAPTGISPLELKSVMEKSEFTVTLDLKNGDSAFRYITSDISYDYVKINAEYST